MKCYTFVLCFALASSHMYLSPLSLINHDKLVVRCDFSVKLQVVPTNISTAWRWVNVTLNNVKYPKNDDWIGLFTISENSSSIDAKHHAPVKFKYVSSVDDKYLKTGNADLSFYLINMREDYIFGYFSGGLSSPVLIASSNRVKILNPNYPMQGHLSLTHSPDKLILQWITKNVTDAQVQWGNKTGNYTRTKSANITTYTAADLCGSPSTDYGWMDPGTIHTVTIDGLLPSMRYYYRFGSSSHGWSDEFSFKSPPVNGPDSAVQIVAYGDLGHGEADESQQILKLEQASLNTTKLVYGEVNNTDLIVHVGDLSYAVGFASQWDEYYTEIEPLAANIPYMVCPGNHETDWPNSTSYFTGKDSGGECNVPYIMRNPMPREKPDMPWYGFDFGCVHFVMMSTENDFTSGSEQYKFLIEHLESVNRRITPWLIFTGHRPMYVDSSDDTEKPDSMQPAAKTLRDSLEDMLKKYKVDIAFWGHHHTYQRTCKMYQGACHDDGIMHVIIGMAGRPLLQDLVPSPPEYFKFLDDQHFGYTTLSINATTLVFQYIRNDDHQVHDQVILRKD